MPKNHGLLINRKRAGLVRERGEQILSPREENPSISEKLIDQIQIEKRDRQK